MTVTLLVCGLLFGIGALFASIRLVRGPTQIDRAVALDVLLAILVGVIVLGAALPATVSLLHGVLGTSLAGSSSVLLGSAS